VQVGQALSTRPDLLPQLYLDELVELQDALPCFSDKVAFATIERELGRPVDQIYAEITPSPIAAARSATHAAAHTAARAAVMGCTYQ
jgi:aarF domain-containing kinase